MVLTRRVRRVNIPRTVVVKTRTKWLPCGVRVKLLLRFFPTRTAVRPFAGVYAVNRKSNNIRPSKRAFKHGSCYKRCRVSTTKNGRVHPGAAALGCHDTCNSSRIVLNIKRIFIGIIMFLCSLNIEKAVAPVIFWMSSHFLVQINIFKYIDDLAVFPI